MNSSCMKFEITIFLAHHMSSEIIQSVAYDN
jgi:hypothetical protein